MTTNIAVPLDVPGQNRQWYLETMERSQGVAAG